MRGCTGPRSALPASTTWRAAISPPAVRRRQQIALPVQSDRVAALMHLSAASLDVAGERQREIERMNVKRLRIVDRLVVARAGDQCAHARGLPRLEAGAELFRHRARAIGEARALVGARDRELARSHADVGPAQLVDGRTHDLHAALRLGVELARMVQPELFDQRARALGEARADEAAIAARGAPADAPALDERRPCARASPAAAPCAGRQSRRPRPRRPPRSCPQAAGDPGLESRVAAYQLAG